MRKLSECARQKLRKIVPGRLEQRLGELTPEGSEPLFAAFMLHQQGVPIAKIAQLLHVGKRRARAIVERSITEYARYSRGAVEWMQRIIVLDNGKEVSRAIGEALSATRRVQDPVTGEMSEEPDHATRLEASEAYRSIASLGAKQPEGMVNINIGGGAQAQPSATFSFEHELRRIQEAKRLNSADTEAEEAEVVDADASEPGTE